MRRRIGLRLLLLTFILSSTEIEGSAQWTQNGKITSTLNIDDGVL